jgi:hypothetical protein
MGKRELLLIVGFVILGAVVYQATAPATAPSQRSHWSTLVDHIRRGIRGDRASVEITKTDTHPLSAGTTEVRIASGTPQITIVGEERQDIASEMRVWSNGIDDTEAKGLAEQTVLKYSEAGESAVFSVTYPDPGTQRATVTLKVPSRLRVYLVRAVQRQSISDVAAVEAPDLRGNTSIRNVAGRVAITHRGGDLSIADVGSLKLSTRGSDARVERVRGEALLQLQSGELNGAELTGPIEIDATAAEVTLEKLGTTRGPIRINANAGRLRLHELGADARVDGRNADLEITMARAATIAIYSEGEDMDVTPPPGGYALDASVTDGQLTVADGSLQVDPAEREQRAAGAIRGGGPTLTLRATRGDIRVRARESTEVER